MESLTAEIFATLGTLLAGYAVSLYRRYMLSKIQASAVEGVEYELPAIVEHAVNALHQKHVRHLKARGITIVRQTADELRRQARASILASLGKKRVAEYLKYTGSTPVELEEKIKTLIESAVDKSKKARGAK